jgi:ferredoxin
MSDQPLTVHCARSGITVEVGPEDSILDAVVMEGVSAPSSCLQGICGTCETRVIAGIPDHRDNLLSEAERASNATMLICCSRALTPALTLDL